MLPVRLEAATLRNLARVGMLPAMLRGLVRDSARRAEDAQGTLASRLADAPESEWEAIVEELVRAQVADVLGHGSPASSISSAPSKRRASIRWPRWRSGTA